MLHGIRPLAYILVLVQSVHAFEFLDPVPFPPFTRIAFGQPFSISWTLDGSESGDRLNLRAKSEDSGGSEWIDLANGVRLSDGKLTIRINRITSPLPSVVFFLEASEPSNLENLYGTTSVNIYSDIIVTATKNEPSSSSSTTSRVVGPSSQNSPSSSATSSTDGGPSSTPPTPTSNEAPTTSPNISPSTTSSLPILPTKLPSDTPSASILPQEIARHPTPIGAIIGGVLGGLAFSVFAISCALLRHRRRDQHLTAIPMAYDNTHVTPISKRERLNIEMAEAQRQREQLQSDLEGIHRSVHGPINGLTGNGLENDTQMLRFEVGMMSERILELEEALQELEEENRTPTHPPPDYASVADQWR